LGTLEISGSLITGPADGSDLGSLPGANTTVVLGTLPEPLSWLVATGPSHRNFDSVGYAGLSGVGPTDTVTKGKFLYLRTNGDLTLRLTFEDATTAVLSIAGTFAAQFGTGKLLTLLEAQGSAGVEWYVCGDE
jgi:hypothetical protein